jgi:hypothetical protein
MRLSRYLTIALVAGATTTIPSFAAAVNGEANIAGTATVSNTQIVFGEGNPEVYGMFQPNTPDTGDFTTLTGGTIADNPSGGPNASPSPGVLLANGMPSGNISYKDFITFTTPGAPGGAIYFDLTHIDAGTGGTAGCSSSSVGSTCTPVINGQLSPFTLRQITSNSVEIDLSMEGVAYTGTTSTGSSFSSGSFTTQDKAYGTIPSILTQLASNNGTGTVTDSYSATFIATAAPEPSSIYLGITGLLMVGGLYRRGRRS